MKMAPIPCNGIAYKHKQQSRSVDTGRMVVTNI